MMMTTMIRSDTNIQFFIYFLKTLVIPLTAFIIKVAHTVFFLGGYDKILHTDRASMECFDPDTQEWTLTAEMEKARSGLVLVALDHYIYAFGGRFRPTDQYFDLVER